MESRETETAATINNANLENSDAKKNSSKMSSAEFNGEAAGRTHLVDDFASARFSVMDEEIPVATAKAAEMLSEQPGAWEISRRKAQVDYSDPVVVKQMWIDQRTDLLEKQKTGQYFDLSRPSVDSRKNKATVLRECYRKLANWQKRKMQIQLERTFTAGRRIPHNTEISTRENIASQFRSKYNRNYPVVAQRYVDHFIKYRRPPFVNPKENCFC